MAMRTLEDVTVSDAYLALMADRGVEYLFANAGTDFAPMIEALARAQALGLPHPRPVTCPHENTAQHMAIGYYLATGRPQLTMFHVNVGTANAMNGLLNASRGQVPILFTAGRTPINEDTLKGHRTLDIHWTQEMRPGRDGAGVGQGGLRAAQRRAARPSSIVCSRVHVGPGRFIFAAARAPAQARQVHPYEPGPQPAAPSAPSPEVPTRPPRFSPGRSIRHHHQLGRTQSRRDARAHGARRPLRGPWSNTATATSPCRPTTR